VRRGESLRREGAPQASRGSVAAIRSPVTGALEVSRTGAARIAPIAAVGDGDQAFEIGREGWDARHRAPAPACVVDLRRQGVQCREHRIGALAAADAAQTGLPCHCVQPGQRASSGDSATIAPATRGCASSASQRVRDQRTAGDFKVLLGHSPPNRVPRPAAG
jgi:hypothetical protein